MEVIAEKRPVAAVVESADTNAIIINLFKCSVKL